MSQTVSNYQFTTLIRRGTYSHSLLFVFDEPSKQTWNPPEACKMYTLLQSSQTISDQTSSPLIVGRLADEGGSVVVKRTYADRSPSDVNLIASGTQIGRNNKRVERDVLHRR